VFVFGFVNPRESVIFLVIRHGFVDFQNSAFGAGVNLAGSEAYEGFICSASMKHRQARGQEENQKKKKKTS
jgi:hypothetical protein